MRNIFLLYSIEAIEKFCFLKGKELGFRELCHRHQLAGSAILSITPWIQACHKPLLYLLYLSDFRDYGTGFPKHPKRVMPGHS